MLFGGEAAEPRCVAAALRDGRPRRLLHVYGPTETTTFATWHEVRHVADDAASVPIGRPIANTEVYVLDDQLEPVPIGVPGEIYIGGPGLARGYLRSARISPPNALFRIRSIRSAERGFIEPATGRACARDGALEFLGRRDRQVKIRGHRIEIDEVETALQRLPQVAQAVVLVHGDTSDTRQLTAYIVLRQERKRRPPNSGRSSGKRCPTIWRRPRS